MTAPLPRWIPSDPGLPRLADLLEPAGAPSLAAEMVREVTGTPVDARTGKLGYVRYHPTKECVAQWAFPTSTGQAFLVSAKLFSGGKGADVAAGASFRVLAESARSGTDNGADLYRHLPDRQLLLQRFPLDVKLPSLPLVTSDSWAAAFVPALGLGQEEMRITEIVAVAYKAWRRCVLRYTMESRGGRRRYFAKVFRDDRGEPMFATLSCLKAKLTSSGMPWEIPAPVAYIPEARMLVLEALEGGVAMSALLKDARGNPSAKTTLLAGVAAVAEGLVPFQRTVVEGLPCVTPAQSLRWLGRKAKGLCHVAPDIADSIEAQLLRLEEKARRLPPEPMVLAHGAFRHAQMLVCGDKVGVVDLDGLRLSGASADAGEFLANLDKIAVRRSRLRPVVGEMVEAFIAGLGGHPYLDRRWLAWHRSAGLVKCALRSLLSLSVKGKEVAEDLLTLSSGPWRC